MDNSSFCCANRDGQLSAITKQKDGLFHVPSEIVVVHEVTLAAAVTNLKRILVACVYYHSWAEVPQPAMLLQGGPLHPPLDSRLRPQADAGSGMATALHHAAAGRQRQLHRHSGVRPPVRKKNISRRRPLPPSPHGELFTAPTPTTQGWPSPCWTPISAMCPLLPRCS
jgi:hypothetical protein